MPKVTALFKCPVTFLVISVLQTSAYGPIRKPTIPCTKGSEEIPSCLHTYLERDIPEITGIVYPHRDSSCTVGDGSKGRADSDRRSYMPLEIPMLVEHCSKIWSAYNCLLDQLDDCRRLADFMDLRHLLYALNKSIRWFCGKPLSPGPESSDTFDHQEVHYNFPALLRSIHCMECFRKSDRVQKSCVHSTETNWVGDSHLWQKILRMDLGAGICYQLDRQAKCFQGIITQSQCKHNSTAYVHLFNTFITSWCESHPIRGYTGVASTLNPHIIIPSITILILLIFTGHLR